MLSNWLVDTEIFAVPDALSVFQKELPLEWIEQALNETNSASIKLTRTLTQIRQGLIALLLLIYC